MEPSFAQNTQQLFSLEGRVAAVTGGGGVLCSAIGLGLASAGARVAVLDFNFEAARQAAEAINACKGEAFPILCDVTRKDSLQAACEEVTGRYGKVDILINGAGGNHAKATTSPEQSFFDLDLSAFESIFRLNFTGTFLACQVFARQMAIQKDGVILNIASMSSLRPLTRIPAYSAAKAAVANLTQWLAVHLAQEYSPQLRVNAIAPGFLLTHQNRFLLTDRETGEWTPRGRSILAHTPMGRMGAPEDLIGTVQWLVSPASAYITGILVPIDGGFSAYSGV
jgi:NAD(P)-dependent dehydrogenase (short-subunit alcohol dehydrogenase family)